MCWTTDTLTITIIPINVALANFCIIYLSVSQSISGHSQTLGNNCVQGLWLEQSVACFGWDQQHASSQVPDTAEEAALRSLLVLWGGGMNRSVLLLPILLRTVFHWEALRATGAL